jgi:orotate phosphoribosyltransferase
MKRRTKMSKNQLIQLIRKKALSYGKFELSGGQISDYYIDLSKIVLYSKGLHLISSLIIDEVDNWKVNAIGGPAYGAIPLVSGVLTLMSDSSFPMKGFFVRKETKGYGKKELIEGHLEEGEEVHLIEDVVTTGKSLLTVVKEVEQLGCKVIQVVSVVDRQQGAADLFDELGISFKSILNVADIL